MSIGNIIFYLLEASVTLILLYIFNRLLLAGETLHRFNRVVWLTILGVSFSLPLLVATPWGQADVYIGVPQIAYVGDSVAMTGTSAESFFDFSVLEGILAVVFALYIVGALTLLLHYIRVYISLAKFTRCEDMLETLSPEQMQLFKRCEQELNVRSKVRYIIHNQDITPFSWLGNIVASRVDIEQNGREIILHELTHIKESHSIDILLLNVAVIVLWFNPAVWLLKRDLQQVHEYCADQSVLECGVNEKEYQLLLIKKAAGARLYSIPNSLNHSNLKNRITMMLQKKSKKMVAAKCLYAIPVIAFMAFIVTLPAVAEARNTISSLKFSNIFANNEIVANELSKSTTQTPDSELFLICDVMPTFQGGDLRSFRDWVATRVKSQFGDDGEVLTGTEIVTFIIEKDGRLSNIASMKSSHSKLYEEMVRVLESSPIWTPGSQGGETVRMQFTLPVIFAVSPSADSAE